MATLSADLDIASGLVQVSGTLESTDGNVTLVGEPITVSGALEPEYNGNFVVRSVGGSSITYMLATATVPTTPATGTIQVESYSAATQAWSTAASAAGYSNDGGFTYMMYVLDKTNGRIYVLSENAIKDQVGIVPTDNSFINFTIRTPRLDLKSNLVKFISRLEVIGDNNPAKAVLRYSDDDYITWSEHQLVDMTQQRPRLSRQGSTLRRAYEFRKPYPTLSTLGVRIPLRVEALELFIKQGTNS